MPVQPTYPGVYVQEVPSGVRTITGVATSIAAFIGRARRGPVDEATTVTSYADFERQFGGLWKHATMPYAVRDFYGNGGSQAVIVRLFRPEAAGAAPQALLFTSGFTAGAAKPRLRLKAVEPGAWGATLRATVDREGIDDQVATPLGLDPKELFNLRVRDTSTGGATETFLAVSLKSSSRQVDEVLETESSLVRWAGVLDEPLPGELQVGGSFEDDLSVLEAEAAALPLELAAKQAELQAELDAGNGAGTEPHDTLKKEIEALQGIQPDPGAAIAAVDVAAQALATAIGADPQGATIPGLRDDLEDALTDLMSLEPSIPRATTGLAHWPMASDGRAPTDDDVTGGEATRQGLYALEDADLFNLLCIPPYAGADVDPTVLGTAAEYCRRRRAMLLVDPPVGWKDAQTAKDNLSDVADAVGANKKEAALYYPRLKMRDPEMGGQIRDFVPCGAVAGVMARTDTQRGVWKAPAGIDAAPNGVVGPTVPLTDLENGLLNPLGVNCIRQRGPAGTVVWGSRTMAGADALASEWKYVPVRRTALFLAESLYRGTQWVVFEPNDEPLWAQIRLSIGAFMHDLFRQGAFQGASPRDAYLVQCDAETTTQNDINLGIVNIVVGFAPLKPAEFVVLKIQQIAGKIAT